MFIALGSTVIYRYLTIHLRKSCEDHLKKEKKTYMYIAYCRNQKSLNEVDTTEYRLSTTAGEYRPTYLIRVSDWEKVPGHEAKNGYCALSYVWAQSGQVVQNEEGEYDCIDNGLHCIVEGYDMDEGDSVRMLPTDEEETEFITYFFPSSKSKATVRFVTYDKLLQQLCKDFQIEYIWYDKICINQSDKESRLHEIKQMHRIYGNACYTVALVPEVHIYDPEDCATIDPVFQNIKANTAAWDDIVQVSLWWKRSWTLEETMASKRMLVIGTDTHLWQHSFHTCPISSTCDNFSVWMLDFVNQQQGDRSVNQALSEAHFRSSSKEHDKIFSLVNIFHDMFQNMKISYKIDIKKALHTFYRTIATNDLAILCFGSCLSPYGFEFRINTMSNHHLPSWTGVSGLHLTSPITTTTTLLQSPHSICDDMLLHLSTKYYMVVSVAPYNYGCFSLLSHDKQKWEHQIDIFNRRQEVIGSYTTVDEDTALIDWAIKMKTVSSIFATHCCYKPQDTPIMQTRPFSLAEDCKECIILPILFKASNLVSKDVEGSQSLRLLGGYTHDYFLPVLKKCTDDVNATEEERYKAVGIFYIGNPDDEDLTSDDPDEILNSVFRGDNAVHDKAKEFIIQ
ncbi:hypothetical protein BDA99DRAFT_537599 [Phascolomyces articulosus]|uniref:Heterokaryon incompatibility domain-containing protein n=1 Tax=Phascolomyces articulosus TaxID=60185 RepID=A0AAD5KA13_9FUNG|nr:hypothetical protein BDA99DRAFT_537599 [Phascolomyces articulosus]